MMDTIGIWKGDGWGGILENEELLSYVESALRCFELDEIAYSYCTLMELFPINPRFKIQDPRLQGIDSVERERRSKIYQQILSILDDLSEDFWAYNAPNLESWQMVLDYFKK